MKKLNILGLAILLAGALLVAGYGVKEYASQFLTDTSIPVIIRYGVTAIIAGLLILIISLILERVRDSKKEN